MNFKGNNSGGKSTLEEGIEMKCANCYWFNGDEYDGYQFCDEREEDVYEDGYCSKWKRKDCYDI